MAISSKFLPPRRRSGHVPSNYRHVNIGIAHQKTAILQSPASLFCVLIVVAIQDIQSVPTERLTSNQPCFLLGSANRGVCVAVATVIGCLEKPHTFYPPPALSLTLIIISNPATYTLHRIAPGPGVLSVSYGLIGAISAGNSRGVWLLLFLCVLLQIFPAVPTISH